MPDEPQVVVCMRISDKPTPAVPSVERYCSRCHVAVWASLPTAITIERGDVHPLCVSCLAAIVEETGEPATFAGFMPGQIASIQRAARGWS